MFFPFLSVSSVYNLQSTKQLTEQLEKLHHSELNVWESVFFANANGFEQISLFFSVSLFPPFLVMQIELFSFLSKM